MGLKDSVFDSRHFWYSTIFWFGAKWRSYGAIDVNRRRFSDINKSVVCTMTKKFHKTKVAQHGKVNFLVGFPGQYDHWFQFRRNYASSNEVQKSSRNTIFNSRQLLVNEFLGRTTGSKSDKNWRKYAKTKWNFDYGPNDSEWPREFKNHLAFELRWKFNFSPLLPSTRDKSRKDDQNEMKFWLWLKQLRMTQGAQKSPRFWAPMKIQLFATFAKASKKPSGIQLTPRFKSP